MRFADSLITRTGVVDFQFSEDGRSGHLILEPSTDKVQLLGEIEVPAEVKISEAPIGREERQRLLGELTTAVSETVGTEAFLGVSYEPLIHKFMVYVALTADPEAVRAAAQVPDLLRIEAQVQVEVIDPDGDARGGQRANAVGASDICTTGFGVIRNGWAWGYTLAGHCAPNSWEINNNNSIWTADRANGGYLDRLFIRANGASWWTRIAPNTVVDMNSTVGHIYKWGYYCHYGKTSNAQRCGHVYQVNRPSVGKWVSATNADCADGDSGGPVYSPGGGRDPRGFISTRQNVSTTTESDCGYVALDDQFAGVNWALL